MMIVSKWEHEAFCDQNCEKQFNQYQENKPERIAEKQKQQELLNKGWKRCGRILIPFEPVKMDCGNLITPSEKLCETCKKNENEWEKRQKTEKDLAERKKECEKKYQQAQNWWNSLSLEQKQVEIKKLEEEWIKKAGGSNFEGFVEDDSCKVVFKNGRLHVYPEDLSKIPPTLLEKFGIPFYPRNEFFGNGIREKFPVYNNSLDAKIKNLEEKLQEAKKFGNKNEISNLEWELQALKDQQQKGKQNPNHSPFASHWLWIIGISLFFLIGGAGVWAAVKKRKKK